ncbi:hypothetical protein IWQ62_000748 [Dispira parvispora]|uniref:Uncharacterized protein n=1 Tax=Dispira parvispora TaxID=1520584 RepID=A0A9W8AV94_9FUNG|nr:hypothetical protein IWQ62_000748 [Dispira parvispora]
MQLFPTHVISVLFLAAMVNFVTSIENPAKEVQEPFVPNVTPANSQPQPVTDNAVQEDEERNCRVCHTSHYWDGRCHRCERRFHWNRRCHSCQRQYYWDGRCHPCRRRFFWDNRCHGCTRRGDETNSVDVN